MQSPALGRDQGITPQQYQLGTGCLGSSSAVPGYADRHELSVIQSGTKGDQRCHKLFLTGAWAGYALLCSAL